MNKQIMYLLVILAVIFLTVLLLSQNQPKTSSQITPEPTPQALPTSQALPSPESQIDQNKTYQAVLTSTAGEIIINLNVKQTPITANNFVYLANKGFYNNTIFHRVIEGFMIQGGDPQGTGSGGPGYRFDDEPFEGEYTRGTVAMANSGPNTNGSQFFIMHQDYALPKNYVVFGKMESGFETLDKIAEAQVKASRFGENSVPVEPVKVLSIKIEEK